VAFVLKITSSVRIHNNDKNFVEGYKCGRYLRLRPRCKDRDIYGRKVWQVRLSLGTKPVR
jgi:hypothetical protein